MSHAHLPFHPAWPASRGERLTGVIPSAPPLAPRAAAGLAAAVLATPALPSAAALAMPGTVEGDQEGEGAVEPGAGAPADADGLAPGEGSRTDAPLDEEESVAGVGSGDGDDREGDEPGAIKEEVPDPDDALPPDGSLPDEGAGGAPAADVGSRGKSGTGAKPKPEPTEGAEQGTSGTGSKDGAGTARDGVAPSDGKRKGARHRNAGDGRQQATEAERRSAADGQPPQVTREAPAEREAPAGGQTPVPAAGSKVASPASPDVDWTHAGSRYHVVRPGESHWSVATDLLGKDATSADIARRVEQIWALNASAIGTGSPPLLIVGQRLRLP